MARTLRNLGEWSQTLPSGADKIGAGFPSYGGGGFVQETQEIGSEDPCASAKSDFERGLCRLGQDPIGGTGKALGHIFSNPFGTMGKGVETIAGGAVGTLGPLMSKALWFGLGAIFLIIGLSSLMRGSNTASEIAAGIREGLAQ